MAARSDNSRQLNTSSSPAAHWRPPPSTPSSLPSSHSISTSSMSCYFREKSFRKVNRLTRLRSIAEAEEENNHTKKPVPPLHKETQRSTHNTGHTLNDINHQHKRAPKLETASKSVKAHTNTAHYQVADTTLPKRAKSAFARNACSFPAQSTVGFTRRVPRAVHVSAPPQKADLAR